MVSFQCARCSSVYISRGDLLEHFKNVHYATFLRLCPVCLWRYPTIGGLLMHQKRASHAGCNLCGQVFPDFRSHLSHYINSHCPIWNVRGQSSYVCFECYQLFSSITGVQNHLDLRHHSMWYDLNM
ncbi:hypothetical protein TSMEX_004329 [Taenia solium]|eukprot:TsM_000620800 transcript=TsM_000620800 gene=TsM_000620800